MDKILVRQGWHPLSEWWLDTIEKFYSKKFLQLIIRAGRRSGKSSTLCRLAVCEALYGNHKVSKGDRGVVAFISVSLDEAQQRLRTVKAILDALGVKWKPISNGVELVDRPILFKTLTCSISAVSGWTIICALCDEASKWLNEETGRNPAEEVISSLKPCMSSMPNARLFVSSSPMGKLDMHAKLFDIGETKEQQTAFCETWVGNPTIDEARTHELERDEAKWAREYAAIPLEDTESGILTSVQLDAKFTTRLEPEEYPPEEGLTYVAAMDPATRGNAWTLVVASRRRGNDGTLRNTIVLAHEWKGTRSNPLDPDTVLGEIAEIVGAYRVSAVVTDQFASDALQSIARRHDLWLIVEPQTVGSKLRMFDDFARKVSDGQVELPPKETSGRQLRQDILNTKKRLTANGMSIQYADTPDGRHADYAPSVASVMAALDKYGTDPPTLGPEVGSPEWILIQEYTRKEMRRLVQAGDYARRSNEGRGAFMKLPPGERVRYPVAPRKRRFGN